METQLELFNQPVPRDVKRLTFNQAIEIFCQLYWFTKPMHKTTGSLFRYMIEFFDGRAIDQIGRLDIENMRNFLATKYQLGISAVNKAHMLVTLMYNKFEAWKEDEWAGGYNFKGLDLPRRNPGSLVKKQKEPAGTRFISPLEFKKIRRVALGLGYQEIADMIRIGIWSRLSPIDLLNLNDDELKENPFQLEVRRRHTKSTRMPEGCLQVIPLIEKMWAILNRYRSLRNPGVKTIFNIKNLRRKMRKIRMLAMKEGMKDFTLRDLRRSGSGYLYEAGISADDRADGMGHTNTRITKAFYTPNIKPHLKKQTLILSKVF